MKKRVHLEYCVFFAILTPYVKNYMGSIGIQKVVAEWCGAIYILTAEDG